jgi:hypothetical protein
MTSSPQQQYTCQGIVENFIELRSMVLSQEIAHALAYFHSFMIGLENILKEQVEGRDAQDIVGLSTILLQTKALYEKYGGTFNSDQHWSNVFLCGPDNLPDFLKLLKKREFDYPHGEDEIPTGSQFDVESATNLWQYFHGEPTEIDDRVRKILSRRFNPLTWEEYRKPVFNHMSSYNNASLLSGVSNGYPIVQQITFNVIANILTALNTLRGEISSDISGLVHNSEEWIISSSSGESTRTRMLKFRDIKRQTYNEGCLGEFAYLQENIDVGEYFLQEGLENILNIGRIIKLRKGRYQIEGISIGKAIKFYGKKVRKDTNAKEIPHYNIFGPESMCYQLFHRMIFRTN